MQGDQSSTSQFIESFKNTDLSGKIALVLATWFFTGLVPGAPGTFGSLAAIPFYVLINYIGSVYIGLMLLVLIPAAILTSGISSRLLKNDDPSVVVIDEVAGFFLAIFLLPATIKSISLCFLLFRMFDISKPFPVGVIDRKMKTGFGIVLDDLVAGIYANLGVRLILLLV